MDNLTFREEESDRMRGLCIHQPYWLWRCLYHCNSHLHEVKRKLIFLFLTKFITFNIDMVTFFHFVTEQFWDRIVIIEKDTMQHVLMKTTTTTSCFCLVWFRSLCHKYLISTRCYGSLLSLRSCLLLTPPLALVSPLAKS